MPRLFPPGAPQLPGPALMRKGKEMGTFGAQSPSARNCRPPSHLAPGGRAQNWRAPHLGASFPGPRSCQAPRPVCAPSPDLLHPRRPDAPCVPGAGLEPGHGRGWRAAGSPAAWTEGGASLGPGRWSAVQRSRVHARSRRGLLLSCSLLVPELLCLRLASVRHVHGRTPRPADGPGGLSSSGDSMLSREARLWAGTDNWITVTAEHSDK